MGYTVAPPSLPNMATTTTTSTKLAIVTGSNKGIGFEIARKLCMSGAKTILACRNDVLGENAANELRSFGFDAEYRNCDISNDDSIQNFASSFTNEFGKLDILVNNAAIAFKDSDPTPFTQQAGATIKPNFFGTLLLTKALLPVLQNSDAPHIVNVASEAGHLRILKSPELKSTFASDSLTMEQLIELMTSFIDDVEQGIHQERGWPNTCYGMSKLGVIAMTRILARENRGMIINCCCPGYVNTDMSSHKGYKTPEEGARTPALLALEVSDSTVTGKFFSEQKEIVW